MGVSKDTKYAIRKQLEDYAKRKRIAEHQKKIKDKELANILKEIDGIDDAISNLEGDLNGR